METITKDSSTDNEFTQQYQTLFESMLKPQNFSNLINNVFNRFGCILLSIETGSLYFYVQCESAKGLENMWRCINDGTLAQQLEEILLTESALDNEDVPCLHIKTTMDEREHQEAYEKFVELGKNFNL